MQNPLVWLERPCAWINRMAEKWWAEVMWFVASSLICGAILSYLLTGLALGANWWDLLTAFGTVGATIFAAVGVSGKKRAESERKELQAHLEDVELQKISKQLEHWDIYVHDVLTAIECILDEVDEDGRQSQGSIDGYIRILNCTAKLPNIAHSDEIQKNVSRGKALELRRLESSITTWRLLAIRYAHLKDGGNIKVLNLRTLVVVIDQMDLLHSSLARLSTRPVLSRNSREFFSENTLSKLKG